MHMRALSPLLALFFVLPFAAKPKPLSMDDALKAAEANAATTEGKAYADEVRRHFAEQHEISLKECTQTANEPEATPFRLALRVGKKGAVEQAFVRPQTRVATCFGTTAMNDHLKRPPKPGWWLVLELTPKKEPAK